MGQDINIDFLEEYKRVDNILKDIYRNSTAPGVTQYIEDMERKTIRASGIIGWQYDYLELKRLRHLRNRAAHDFGSLWQDIFTEEDILWIEDFYDRILSQTDPIALLRKKEISSSKRASVAKHTVINTSPVSQQNSGGTGCLFALIGVIMAVAVLLIIFL